MLLRNYVKTDCAQLAWLFYDTVHTVNAKAAPHNYVCGSQRIFCTSSAVSKTGNTYSIPSFLKLCTGTKSLAELPCQIMRCCPKDYTQEQLAAWATGKVNLEAWNESFQAHHTVVAEMDGKIVGFGDMDEIGYLDRLYVHKDYRRRGAATAICDALEQNTEAAEFTTHASITARPFFEKRGYTVVREQQVERGGVWLTNFIMKKEW